MKHKLSLLGICLLLYAGHAHAQWSGTPIETTPNPVGIGTLAPLSFFDVVNGSVLFHGNAGSTPISGGGTRFMWVPEKASLRFGELSTSGFWSTLWDDPNIGQWTFAGGFNTKAEGYGSMAYGWGAQANLHATLPLSSNEANISLGYFTTANGHVSIAIGDNCISTGGGGATALGNSNTASGGASMAIGLLCNSSGSQSVALGMGQQSTGAQSMALGFYGQANNYRSLSLSTDEAIADGDNSIAMGARASNAGHSGSFVYGEYDPAFSVGIDPLVVNDADMQWKARAQGGFVFHNDLHMNQDKSVYITDGNVGVGVQSMQAKLHVKDGAILADGGFGSGVGGTPASGAGTRMMWIPDKAAFRAGQVNATQWDNAMIGRHSGAGGENTIAEPPGSFVWGLRAVAANYPGATQNQACISMGANTTASGWASIALGNYAQAQNANGAYAMGGNAVADGSGAMALGSGAPYSGGNKSVAIGPYTNVTGDEAMALGTYGQASGRNSLSLSTYGSQATGDYSIAMGHNANNQSHQGSFAYADYDPSFSLPAVENTADYQWMARAQGGFVFHNDGNLDPDQSLTFDGGNLGIGTGAGGATEKLHVDGKVRIDNIPVNASSVDVLVKDAAGVINYRTIPGLGGGGSSEWEKVPGPGAPTNINDVMYRNGSTGINTSNPQAKFHVVNPTCSGTPGIRVTATPSAVVCGPGSSPGPLFQADGTTSSTTTAPKVVITQPGNLGLNTTTPQAQLDLHKDDMLFSGPNHSFRIHNQHWLANGSLIITPASVSGVMAPINGIAISQQSHVAIGTMPSVVPNERLTVNGHVIPSMHCAFNLGRNSALAWNTIFLCNNPVVGSDARLKENIEDISYGIEEIKKLRPVSYNLKCNNGDGRSLGLIAQETREVISEIVYQGDDEQQTLGIKYSELIPVLVKAMQQQQGMIADAGKQATNAVAAQETRISELEAKLAEMQRSLELCCQANNNNNTGLNNHADVIAPRLDQNVPNPFDHVTSIGYYLPTTVQQAKMLIFDMNGRQLRDITLQGNGEGKVQFSSDELAAGMYLYSLVADGKEVATKRMILSGK